jgi:hypothetical protein
MKQPPHAHALKEHEARVELLIRGMHHLQLKVDFIYLFYFCNLKKLIDQIILIRYIQVKH